MIRFKKGYTLAETVVTISVVSVIIGMLSVFYITVFSANAKQMHQLKTEADLLLRYVAAHASASHTVFLIQDTEDPKNEALLNLVYKQAQKNGDIVDILLFRNDMQLGSYIPYHKQYKNPPNGFDSEDMVSNEDIVFGETFTGSCKIRPDFDTLSSPEEEKNYLLLSLYYNGDANAWERAPYVSEILENVYPIGTRSGKDYLLVFVKSVNVSDLSTS